MLLIGEFGCGKSFLALEAANEFIAWQSTAIELVVVDRPGDLTPALLETAAGRELVVIVAGIDDGDPESAGIVEQLAAAHTVRLIGTARRLAGVADRLVRNPSVQQIAIGPLSLEESEALLADLLGVERLSPKTLDRWHRSTGGNRHALVTLALAAERRGDVRRARGVAWVPSRLDRAPSDFIDQLGALSDVERATLDLVAFAAPLSEPELLHLLDRSAVSALIDRQVLTVSSGSDGTNALTTRLPILSAAVLAQLSPLHRIELAAKCFDALDSDSADQFTTLTAKGRSRIVRFGIEGGRPVPIDWVWQALRAGSRSAELPFLLRLALVAMHHENPQRAAEAVSRAAELAHFLGDHGALAEALEKLSEFLGDAERFESLTQSTQIGLIGLSINLDPFTSTNPEHALAEIDRWVVWAAAHAFDGTELARAGRLSILALAGRLGDAIAVAGGTTNRHELEAEWVITQARSIEAMLRVQRGEFRSALALAESTRQAVLLHDIPPTIAGELEDLAIFLAHWARGTKLPTRYTVDTSEPPGRDDLEAARARSGISDLTIALLAIQEARWYDAANLAERVVAVLEEHDPFGLIPLAHGISALAHAALGENERAREALMRSGAVGRGVARAIGGIIGILALRARHWLRDPDLQEVALGLADWAASQGLALIELEALDIYVYEARSNDPQLLERVERAAARVDPPIGDTILTHVRGLMGHGGGETAFEERLLSELGLWMPLPPVEHLTEREREIALFTALGYPSKHVAEHLHLSARTVETHLARVYSKLGVSGREELRLWFSRRRETASQ